MIDGVKIDIPSLDGATWLSNDLLNFHSKLNEQTGEIFDGVRVAIFQGLKFIITKSKKYNNKYYYTVKGSLHKYYNKGEHNANDFNYEALQGVILDLKKKFNINPETALLHNLEFGVNIKTDIPVNEVLKNCVCSGAYSFGMLKIEGLSVGKVIQKQETNLKVYDKGKQAKTGQNNLLRFELAVKKMHFLKKYQIAKLSDLQQKEKISILRGVLLKQWNDIIYFDKKVNYKALNNMEQKKLLQLSNPRNWQDFNNAQRKRNKKYFNRLIATYGIGAGKENIYNLLAQKCTDLQAEKCTQIIHDLKESTSRKMYPNYPLEYIDKMGTINYKKEESKKGVFLGVKKGMFEEVKKRSCLMCGCDISNKRKSAKYCSKKHNNKYNNMKRTKRRRNAKEQEKAHLLELQKGLYTSNLHLIIYYTVDGVEYADQLRQKEIEVPKELLREIKRVEIKKRSNGEKITLTSYRAKAIIRTINTINNYKKVKNRQNMKFKNI